MRITVKAARVNSGMTQAEVAEEIGVSLTTYNRLENNSGELRVKQAKRLAEIFGTELDDLFFDSDSISDVTEEDEL